MLLHQPMGGIGGQAADVEIHAREIIKIRTQLNEILANCTGQDLEQIKMDTERDFFMSPEESRDYGLIDEIIQPSALGVSPPAEAAG